MFEDASELRLGSGSEADSRASLVDRRVEDLIYDGGPAANDVVSESDSIQIRSRSESAESAESE